MKKSLAKTRMASFVLMMLVTSCYEGWNPRRKPKEENQTPAPNPSGPPVPPPEQKKLYAYTLFEIFLLKDSALEDANCYGDTGLAEFRRNERQLRLEGLLASTARVSEKVVEVRHEIEASDCQTLSDIESASKALVPWTTPEDAPTSDPEKRPFLHLKVALWLMDATGTPPASVKETVWPRWLLLAASGEKTLSLHYFNVEDSSGGYFKLWSDAVSAATKKNSTPVDSEGIDPTADGIAARAKKIADDTAEFLKWLQEKAA